MLERHSQQSQLSLQVQFQDCCIVTTRQPQNTLNQILCTPFSGTLMSVLSWMLLGSILNIFFRSQLLFQVGYFTLSVYSDVFHVIVVHKLFSAKPFLYKKTSIFYIRGLLSYFLEGITWLFQGYICIKFMINGSIKTT